jgi:hypothetical protein
MGSKLHLMFCVFTQCEFITKKLNKMTERTKTIKGLISGQVDMGTFGLVELELIAIEKENVALRKHAVMQRSEQLIAFCDWYKRTDFNCEGHSSNDCVDEYLKSN